MKISLYLKDETWSKFKRNVLRRTGDLRSLSAEVQSLIEDNTIEDSLRKGFEQMGIDIKPMSFSEIVPVKPSVPTSSASMIRKMRDGRLGQWPRGSEFH